MIFGVKQHFGEKVPESFIQNGKTPFSLYNSVEYSEYSRLFDILGEKDGVSGDTVRNYISLNNLTPPLMQMVDEKKIALTPAYQLAALSEQEQELLVETMSSEQATPSLSQAQRMKKLSQIGELNEGTMLSIMMEQKKPVKLDPDTNCPCWTMKGNPLQRKRKSPSPCLRWCPYSMWNLLPSRQSRRTLPNLRESEKRKSVNPLQQNPGRMIVSSSLQDIPPAVRPMVLHYGK